MEQHRYSPAYSYTPSTSQRPIFLRCCFKHVTGQFVSRMGQEEDGTGGGFITAQTTIVFRRNPSRPFHVAGYYTHFWTAASATSWLHTPLRRAAISCFLVHLDLDEPIPRT